MPSFSYFELPVENSHTMRGSLHYADTENAPWFVFCHGFTSQRMGPGYLFVKLSKTLAYSGFNSLRFDFCGSGESDGNFCDMNVSTMDSDLTTIVNWLRKEQHASRIILLGHSFGAIIASNCSIYAQGLVLISPVANPQNLICKQSKLIESGPNAEGFYEYGPHEMRASFMNYLKIDPVKSLCDSFRGPLLLVHGSEDKSISVEESGRYISEARKIGIDSQYHILQGADHNFSRVSDVRLLCNTVTNWAKEHFCD